jgi:hypothetical protein
MIIMNTIAKSYESSKERPSSTKSRLPTVTLSPTSSITARSVPKTECELALSPGIMQTFVHNFIDSKMKFDQFPVQVPHSYVEFLSKLPQPLSLGEMRTLREDKFLELRSLLRKDVGG